jgi:uncharacterized membrane protein YfcA
MKPFSPKFTTIFSTIILGYLAYYALLRDNFLHTSISSIIKESHHLAIITHIVVLGFLPVYIAAVIFGAGLLGIYIGSRLTRFINPRAQINTLLKRVALILRLGRKNKMTT